MSKLLPLSSVIISISVWSLWPVVVRKLGIPVYKLVIYTSFLTSLFFTFLFILKRPSYKKGFLGLFVAGALLLFLNSYCYFKAAELSPISVAALTHYTAPIFVALFSPLLGERRKRLVFHSIVISTLGLFLALNGVESLGCVLGPVLGLLSGLFYGLGVIVAKAILRAFSPYSYLVYASMVSLPLYLPLFLMNPPESHVLPTLFLISLFLSVVPASLYLWGLGRLKAQEVAVVSYLEPILASLWGFVFFGEELTLKLGIGGFLVLIGTYLVVKEE